MGQGGCVIWIGTEGREHELLPIVSACNHETLHVSAETVLTRLGSIDPDTVIIELDSEQLPLLSDLAARLPARTRVLGIGDLRAAGLDAGALALDCVLFSDPDEETLRAALAGCPPLDLDNLLSELMPVTISGRELAATLSELVASVARAFGVDDCLLVLPQEGTCYSARELTPDVLQALMPLCDVVCQFATAVVAPPRPSRPYRAFLGVPIAHENAPALAYLVLCRTTCVPFDRHARRYLNSLARRLAADLAWRLAQERASRDSLRDAPRVDPVLGVANRTALDDELPQLVAASERVHEPFSVAIIDVDGLRLINERRGYPAGDAVLGHVAQHALKNTRPTDLVARYAGDAVAIVLPGVDADNASTMLTQILSAIDATPVILERKPIHLTVSAGIAQLQYDSETGETALARAMAARRKARRHGHVIATASQSLVADAPIPSDFVIGTTLGGVYQIRHEISRGAFGVVYRAEDMALGRQVALKLLRSDLAANTAFVERFRSEAATLARIRNPSLVQVYTFGVDGEAVFFAMELVEGQSLHERIESARNRLRHLPLAEIMSTLEQIATALDALHQAGMLHRDVKPENVLIDRIHRRYVLIDVGIAVRLGGDKLPAGTPGFTAPEVFSSRAESPATDVYSLAALAYVLLTLESPFPAGWSSLEILETQLRRPACAPTELRPDLPREIDSVLLDALDPDPERRPQSARAFMRALTSVLAPAESGRRSRPRLTVPPVRRRPVISVSQSSLRNTPADRRRSSRHAAPEAPSTRGVLFRSVYEILGARRGSAWIADLQRNSPELAQTVGPHSTPLGWHPTPAFIAILESLASDSRARHGDATQIGRTAAAVSFPQFYGADTSAVTPEQALRAIDNLWHCYHNWGTAYVKTAKSEAEVTLLETVAHPLVCATTSGLLAGIVAHAGGSDVQVAHRTCIVDRASRCVFQLSWRAPG